MRNLLDNQSTAIEKLQKYKVGALFMEPGTGKTRAAYELVKSVKNIDCIIWLTPFQTKENLKTEIDLCGGLNNLYIIGIESLQNSDKIYLEAFSLTEQYKCFIVCDESLKIKNFTAKRTKRIIELGKNCEYKLILNGSPITRNLLDIWSQFEFLSPKILNMGLAEFKNTFCEWVEVIKTIGNKRYKKEYIKGYHNIDHLYNLIGHYIYECDLRLDVKENYKEMHYTIEDEIRENYTFLKEKYLDDKTLQAMNNNIFLELTQKMQHLYSCSNGKLALLDEVLQKHKQEQIIVYCKYIDSQELVKKEYPSLMVLSYQKHSLGLNLQDKNVIVYFDKTFDYALRFQSSRRIYRTGQLKDCVYYDFTGDVGLEGLIEKNIKNKANLLDYFKQVGNRVMGEL